MTGIWSVCAAFAAVRALGRPLINTAWWLVMAGDAPPSFTPLQRGIAYTAASVGSLESRIGSGNSGCRIVVSMTGIWSVCAAFAA
jgi:hypothetical protein